MTTETRVNKVEQAVQSQALAFVLKKYNLTERDLEVSAALKVVCAKVSAAYDHAIDALTDAVNEHHSSNGKSSHVDRINDLWTAAGLDREKQYMAAKTVVDAFEMPLNVTIDTLLDLDRQVYEACRITESEAK